jgi:D-alanyl-D-alanine carboxypeptidase
MKKVISMIAVLALVCFATMVFAADAAAPAAAPAAAAPAKAEMAKTQVIKGKITKVDTAANTIDVKGKTFTLKAEDMANVKKGQWVKITAAAGSLNADKIEVIKAKKAVKKAAAAEKKAEKKEQRRKQKRHQQLSLQSKISKVTIKE